MRRAVAAAGRVFTFKKESSFFEKKEDSAPRVCGKASAPTGSKNFCGAFLKSDLLLS
jgi:hypothetical protein